MENTIIVIYNPFDKYQSLHVFNDKGSNLKTLSLEIDEVSSAVKALASEYNVSNVELHGNANYLLKFQKELSNEFSQLNIVIK